MSYRLLVEPIGQTVEVADGQTMLDACLRAGIWLPHACSHGLCGTCKVAVLEGYVEHNAASPFALMDFERQEGQTLACTATLESDCVIEADIETDPEARPIPIRDFKARIERTEMLTSDILGLWMALPGEGLDFQAGQYVTVCVPETDGPRSFSIASPPSQRNLIELHVKLVPNGRATPWLHKNARPGMEFTITGPYGRFYVRRAVEMPRLFVAGGSGLSAPQSMILDLFEQGETAPITLVHGVRTEADLYNTAIFRALASRHSNFRYFPALSGDAPDWTGEKGLAHEVVNRLYDGQFEGNHAYLCGPPAMIDACVTTLMRGRLFEKSIFAEKFVTPADAEQARSPLFKRI